MRPMPPKSSPCRRRGCGAVRALRSRISATWRSTAARCWSVRPVHVRVTSTTSSARSVVAMSPSLSALLQQLRHGHAEGAGEALEHLEGRVALLARLQLRDVGVGNIGLLRELGHREAPIVTKLPKHCLKSPWRHYTNRQLVVKTCVPLFCFDPCAYGVWTGTVVAMVVEPRRGRQSHACCLYAARKPHATARRSAAA